jgi:DNA repair protein RadA/Sms
VSRQSRRYVCRECGASFLRWSGRCPNCAEWDTLEEVAEELERARFGASGAETKAYVLDEIPDEPRGRILTGMGELDRALGGGVLPGSTILLGGDPGIGKSTLLLQAFGRMAAQGVPCLYVTCEESLSQIKLRAKRLGLAASPLKVAAESSLDAIVGLLGAQEPAVAAVDSIQMVNADGVDSPVGSIRHLNTSASELVRLAKAEGFAIFLIGHVTKQGAIAGPKALEHVVDTVLYFESERFQSLRILRAAKNRFGSVNEIGVFQMTDEGLADVPNPSELFLAERDARESGSVVTSTIEGNRALLVEIQALVAPSAYGTPERKASGLDYRRLGMLLPVLERRAGVNLGAHDTFANVAGGVRLLEPAADLPLALAIVSSARDAPFPHNSVAIGEVGLGGEVRAVSQMDKRLKEAQKLGFDCAFIPKGNAAAARGLGISVVPVAHIRDAISLLERQ